MLKGTSLASTVTLMDLTGVAKYIISFTTFGGQPIEVFIVAGGIYLFLTKNGTTLKIYQIFINSQFFN